MRLIFGYTFHSWELLGMWAWTPAFIAAVFAATGAGMIRAVELAGYLSAAFHLTGLVASSSMGRLSDRLGRRVVLFALRPPRGVLAGVRLADRSARRDRLRGRRALRIYRARGLACAVDRAHRSGTRVPSRRPWRFARFLASEPVRSRRSCSARSST